MGREFNRKKDGDIVEPRDLNWLYSEFRRLRGMRGANLDINQGTGQTPPEIVSYFTPTMHARLTGGYAAGYPWEEVTIGPGRTIATSGISGGPASGSPAYERRVGDTSLTADGTVYQMRRSPSSAQWVFPHRGSSGTGIGTVTLAGCPCTASPTTIHMTSSKPDSNNQIFQSATLVYGPTPTPLLPVVLTTSSYLSTSSFLDPILNLPFFYFLTCSINSYTLTRVYVQFIGGGPGRDSVRYKWVPGFEGDTCTPFLMSVGQMFPGGDTSCVVTLSQ